MRSPWPVLVALSLGGSACNLPPKDPFVAAERALRRDDLLQALRAYDSVPVAHERYPEARVGAGAVELRMRRCHELILEALMLRSQWRDQEALAALDRARQQWSAEPSLDQWVQATRHRMLLFAGRTAEPAWLEPKLSPTPRSGQTAASQPGGAVDRAGEVEVVAEQSERRNESAPPVKVPAHRQPSQDAAILPVWQPVPIGELKPVIVVREPQPAAASSTQVALPIEPAVATELSTEPRSPAESAPASNRSASGQDPVALALVGIEGRLGSGELGGAIGELIELARCSPDEPRVGRRLARLLNQRALLNYGQGSVAAAIADWRRVLQLDADNQVVRSLLERALAESAASDR